MKALGGGGVIAFTAFMGAEYFNCCTCDPAAFNIGIFNERPDFATFVSKKSVNPALIAINRIMRAPLGVDTGVKPWTGRGYTSLVRACCSGAPPPASQESVPAHTGADSCVAGRALHAGVGRRCRRQARASGQNSTEAAVVRWSHSRKGATAGGLWKNKEDRCERDDE